MLGEVSIQVYYPFILKLVYSLLRQITKCILKTSRIFRDKSLVHLESTEFVVPEWFETLSSNVFV